MRVSVLLVAVLTSCGGALSAAGRRVLVVDSYDGLAGCAFVGEVSGTRSSAIEKAAARAATHLIWTDSVSIMGGVRYVGEAYNCLDATAVARARAELARDDAGQQKRVPPARSEPDWRSGSCFFAASGIAITNNHVIDKSIAIEVIDAAGTRHAATVLRSSKESDLAVLDVPSASEASTIGFATAAPTLGLDVFTIGYPYPGLLGADPKFSDGSVSGLTGGGDKRYLQITVPVQPGNSGGPLTTLDGQVVGVVTAKLNALQTLRETGSIPENVNFAIKASELEPLVRGLALSQPRPTRTRAEAIERTQAAACQVVATMHDANAEAGGTTPDAAAGGPGELTREQVATVVRAAVPRLAACERSHGPLPEASVKLIIHVDPSGKVGAVEPPFRYRHDEVVGCLAKVFKATTFPAAAKESTFRYTYKRQADDE